MKRLILLAMLIAENAFADSKTISSDGIDSKSTGLDGSLDSLTGVNIGEADRLRSAKAGYDDPENSAPNTIPYGVYYQSTGSMAAKNDAIGDGGHATEVAGVIVGKATPNATYEGVAPAARLHSIRIGDLTDDSLVGVVLQSLATANVVPEIKAINLSFGFSTSFIEDDGRSVMTQFVDWSARRHNVLYVVSAAGAFEPSPRGKPDDNYNGITVGSSDTDSEGNFYSTFGGSNATPDFAGTERSYIDLLAPGDHVQVYGVNASEEIRFGTSYAAGHVTGAVALLEQYKDRQSRGPALNDRFLLEVRHSAYKAIMMNSADKLAGVQGSFRDVTNHLGQKWNETLAYFDNTVPLDSGMGTGHLNVRRAVQQFSSGRYQSTGEISGDTVPLVAWAQDNISGGDTNVYVLDPPVGAGTWATITLCWDRIVEHSGGLTYHYGDLFDPYADPYDKMPDLDLYLVRDSDNSVVASSISSTHNEEHIFFQLTAERYKIVVLHAGGLESVIAQYGLAWWIGEFSPLAGDYNGNGSVGPEDYDLWRSSFGATVTPLTEADGNGNGVIDTADFVVWRNAMTAGSSSLTAVPEPSTVFLATLWLTVAAAQSRIARKSLRLAA